MGTGSLQTGRVWRWYVSDCRTSIGCLSKLSSDRLVFSFPTGCGVQVSGFEKLCPFFTCRWPVSTCEESCDKGIALVPLQTLSAPNNILQFYASRCGIGQAAVQTANTNGRGFIWGYWCEKATIIQQIRQTGYTGCIQFHKSKRVMFFPVCHSLSPLSIREKGTGWALRTSFV